MTRCDHCDEPIRKGDKYGACRIHGWLGPGRALPRGVPRCTVCVTCLAKMTDDAPIEPVKDTRKKKQDDSAP